MLAGGCRGGECLLELCRGERLTGSSVGTIICQGMISTLESIVSPSCGNARLLSCLAGVPGSLIGLESWVAGNGSRFSVLGVGCHAAVAASRSTCRLNAVPGEATRQDARRRSPDLAEFADRRFPEYVRPAPTKVSYLPLRRIDSRRPSHYSER